MSSTKSQARPAKPATYRRPQLRTERLVGTVLGCTTFSCGSGLTCVGGTACCDKFGSCTPG